MRRAHRPRSADAAIYVGFLPTALSTGAYRAAPDATVVVGHGLAHIPDALRQLKNGVSAKKLVVTL